MIKELKKGDLATLGDEQLEVDGDELKIYTVVVLCNTVKKDELVNSSLKLAGQQAETDRLLAAFEELK
jgi:hypothetical protein